MPHLATGTPGNCETLAGNSFITPLGFGLGGVLGSSLGGCCPPAPLALCSAQCSSIILIPSGFCFFNISPVGPIKKLSQTSASTALSSYSLTVTATPARRSVNSANCFSLLSDPGI